MREFDNGICRDAEVYKLAVNKTVLELGLSLMLESQIIEDDG